MKTNFKKLAVLAGTTAVMAAGSMSAHAVITSVPAPAQLVPLFYYSTANNIDTEIRVVVPRTVGSDTVINLLGGITTPPTAVSGSWNATNASLSVAATARIHWFWMDQESAEVVNSSFPVTADDEIYFSAANMPCQIVGSSSCTTLAPQLTNGQAGYLILTNESAAQGGAPTFAFSADAWLENGGAPLNGLASAYYIPVLGLADAADTITTYPTPTNNVVEAYSSTVADGPIASPIQTGMRTSSTLAGSTYRVIDVPIFPLAPSAQTTVSTFSPGPYANFIVAWADDNGLGNGLSGKLYTVNNSEVQVSNGTFSLPYQLNTFCVAATSSSTTTLSTCGVSTAFSDLYSTNALSNPTTTSTGYIAPTLSNLANGGFLKLVIDAPVLPVAAPAQQGAYSSVVIFNLPLQGSGTAGVQDDSTEIAVDTGFFSAN